ncbi:DUF4112 domain-containing protein [Marinimicrobium locisalis]|uniref:DUF4112 domain-containing protein n=1 Tax=Marinimicrobium locisalis TaxID=546022 RepID=UPI0032215BDD
MADESTHHHSSPKLERLAWYLDSAFRIPGTQVRLGVDPLIGLVPVVGDAVSALLSCYILNEASRLGVPRSLLVRMGFNILVDATLGAIPLVGDIFDVTWRANRRNLMLLQSFQDQPQQTRRRSRLFSVALGAALLAALVGFIALMVWLIGLLWQAITAI